MADLKDIISKKTALQIVVKGINNTVSLDSLVPILLVFEVYLRMQSMDPPVIRIIQKAATIDKAMNRVQKIRTKNEVANALKTRNGLLMDLIHDFLLKSNVLVWQESNAGRTGK